MNKSAVIFGLEGLKLTSDERAFFKEVKPWGFILFARNLDNPDQIKSLTAELRNVVGYDAPILIDQEGGRVARLKAPYWREWLPALDHVQGMKAENQALGMYLRSRWIADELRELGIDANCAPVLDVASSETHEIIANRCYGNSAFDVAKIGRAVANGLLDGGVLPIIKHIPGHGNATVDSHLELPSVATSLLKLIRKDFVPFKELNDLPLAMTAHVTYSDIDPENCGTISDKVINVIRENIDFKGLLMSDDLSMKALSGSFEDRTNQAISAGCDLILHCNGNMDEMKKIVSQAPALTKKQSKFSDEILELRSNIVPFNKEFADERLTQFMDVSIDA